MIHYRNYLSNTHRNIDLCNLLHHRPIPSIPKRVDPPSLGTFRRRDKSHPRTNAAESSCPRSHQCGQDHTGKCHLDTMSARRERRRHRRCNQQRRVLGSIGRNLVDRRGSRLRRAEECRPLERSRRHPIRIPRSPNRSCWNPTEIPRCHRNRRQSNSVGHNSRCCRVSHQDYRDHRSLSHRQCLRTLVQERTHRPI